MIVTVEDLLNEGIQRQKRQTFKVHLKQLNKDIVCRTITAIEYLEILGSRSKNKAAEIIYNCCDVFKDEKLIQKFNCSYDPVEVVEKILNYATIYHLSEYILKKSDIDIGNKEHYILEVVDDVKKL